MEKLDIFQLIPVILNGSNYAHWVEAMREFLKGRKLWQYVTGDIVCPVKQTVSDKSQDGVSKSKEDVEKDFAERLKDWDSKNHQIITWFRNTSTPSIHLQFGRFETAKEVWDRLAKHYTIYDLSYQYQLLKEFRSLKQERGQTVFDFLAQMEIIWDQLTSCEPVLKNSSDAKAYEDYRNRTRLIQFLMALTDDYEPVRASLLHQKSLLSLEDALPRLKSEETRLGLTRYKSETAFAATERKDKICQNCNRPGHSFPDCSSIECRKCKQKGHIGSNCPKLFCHYCKLSGHLITVCPTRPPRSDQHKYQPRPNNSLHVPASTAATATESTPSTSLNTPSVSPLNIESLLKQLLSFSSNTPATLFTPPGNSKWYIDFGCFNHMSPLRHLFLSLSTTTNAPSVNTANGSLLHATHQGFISQSNIHLPDTYFIPKLNFNLIFVSQLIELNFDVTFSISGCHVQDRRTEKIIWTGCKVGQLFELENLHVPYLSNLCVISSPSPLHLWHRRLAYSSLNKLRPLMSTDFLAEQGTLSEFSCPGTSQQNGRGEHKHRHILDSVREMLISSSCPERAWGEAVLTVVHVINRLLSSILSNTTPFKHLYHTPPDYSSLRVFGCVCSILLQPHEYTKFELRARMCYFLGYGYEHKGSTSSPLLEAPPVPSSPSSNASRPDDAPAPAPAVRPPSSIRPFRVRNPPPHLLDYHCFSTILYHHEPQSFREAFTNPNWQQAMQEKIQALEKAHTWDLVDLPSGQEVVDSR
ncbi:uncharacterized protein LOC130979796 [Arachis stenosperma]|uniref:uncharacterized protein LOC130979796 n=1 Tax=Arachis stenosperma TaxID=217475 RepID=UPI0025AD95E6|nr:uncharacterized protein LOC130979796 [Arachis stenosperma]